MRHHNRCGALYNIYKSNVTWLLYQWQYTIQRRVYRGGLRGLALQSHKIVAPKIIAASAPKLVRTLVLSNSAPLFGLYRRLIPKSAFMHFLAIWHFYIFGKIKVRAIWKFKGRSNFCKIKGCKLVVIMGGNCNIFVFVFVFVNENHTGCFRFSFSFR